MKGLTGFYSLSQHESFHYHHSHCIHTMSINSDPFASMSPREYNEHNKATGGVVMRICFCLMLLLIDIKETGSKKNNIIIRNGN